MATTNNGTAATVPSVRWEVRTTRASMPADVRELNALLEDGWEPFAATEGGPQTGTKYHLRRQVQTATSAA